MYRKNHNKGLKPVLHRQSTSNDVKNDSKDASSENSIQNSIRSTTKILNLFKKPIDVESLKVPTQVDVSKKSDITSNEKTKENNTFILKNDDDIKENSSSIANANSRIIFNVVIGKKSTRKHKKWDDDGTLEVIGKTAVLKDTDGNIIHRTKINPDSLVEGFRMHVDNKEIEIVDRVVCNNDLSNEDDKETVEEPPQKRLKIACGNSIIPFRSVKKGLQLTHEPLVMPLSNDAKEWSERDTLEKEQEVSVDPCLASVLRPHQRHGVVFLYECAIGLKVHNHYGAILADEMGLGKTLQCITLMWTLLKKGPYGRPVVKRMLIVTPSSLCNNWNKEFVRWLGYHRISPYVVNAKNKPKDFRQRARNSVMIISYDMLIRCQEEIEELTFDLVVCDEGHRLKNNDIKAAKFLQNMECKRRILLTGTPIQNDLQEFYALIDLVNPGILGSYNDYKSYYENPIVASRCPHACETALSLGKERASELHECTKRFILRRTQDTINKYLPSKHETVIFCRPSSEQEKLYSHITNVWFDKIATPGKSVPHLTVITALKKICNHPELLSDEKKDFLLDDLINFNKFPEVKRAGDISGKYCGKITIVQTLMRNLKNTDEKLVLVSYYTQTLNLLETVCNTENLRFLRLDGSTASNTRFKIVEQFNSKDDDSKVFLLSAKAGGVGLNLPGASRLVLFDSDWNPASDAQAMARIWREGQKKDVYIYRLLTTGTIEEKIFQRQISKAGLSETVVDLNSFASLKLSTSELKDLFTLRTDTICLTHDLMKCSCDGKKDVEKLSENSTVRDTREFQFVLEDKPSQKKLTLNQLLEWEHYKTPIPENIMQEMMLSESRSNITFAFKNSTLR